MRRTCFSLLLAAVLAGCGHGTPDIVAAERWSCSAATVLDKLSPAPEVTFVQHDDPALQNWRTSVGPPAVDRAGRTCEDAPIDSLLVVSWNVHIGHAEIPRFVNDLRAGRVLPGVRVRHFVILVQEAFREGDDVPSRAELRPCPRRMGGKLADVTEQADSLGLALYYVPSMRNGCDEGALQDRGNAILSTLPLTNLKAVELPLMRQRRVAALADVKGKSSKGSDWTLSLASVHFENRGSGLPWHWIQGRADQARVLVEALPEGGLAALGGDFNTLNGASEPAVGIMGEHFKNSNHQRIVTFTSYVIMRSQLDYLFFRAAGDQRSKYWRARSRYGSDHYPIMGFVRLS